jgi:hypothetical protein
MVKEALADRRLLLDDVIELVPDCARTARVYDVIQWAPGFGRVKAEQALKRLREPGHRRLGDLNRRQRRELILILARSNRQALWGAAHREYIC